MKLVFTTAGIALALLAGGVAHADVTVDFPGPGTDWLSQTNGTGTLAGGDQTDYMWTTGDYVANDFADTGLISATGLDTTFTIENVLGSEDLGVDVVLNGVTVGSFTIEACGFCFELQTYNYAFSFDAIAGDDYTIEFILTNTISGGEGSIAWLANGSTTLIGAVIPEPATWALMIAGFGLVGAAVRRRERMLA